VSTLELSAYSTESARPVLVAFALEPAGSPAACRDAIARAVAAWRVASGASDAVHGEDGLALVYGDLHVRACAAAGKPSTPASPGATAALGHRLLALHASVPRPWPIMRIDMIDPDFSARRPKLLMRPQPAWGTLRVDGETLVTGIPPVAWQHDICGEPLLAWTIARAKADAETFAKDAFIGRLAGLCRIAVETVALVRAAS
jgi:hypothetical protein